MPGIFFVFAALFTSIFSFVVLKTVLKDGAPHDATAYAVISAIFGGTYALIFYSLTSFHFHDLQLLTSPTAIRYISLDIFLWALGSFLYYPAYKHTPVSESTILTTPEGFFAFFFGLFLFKTEVFQISHLLGGILILLSVVFLYIGKGHWKWNKYTLWILVSMVIFGAALVVDNVIITRLSFSSPFFFEVFNFGLTGITMLLLYPPTLRKLPTILLHTRPRLTVMTTSLVSVFSYFLVYTAYKRGVVASQSAFILSTQTIFVVLLGMLLFKEKGSLRKKLLSALIAAMGVYLLS